MLSRLTIKNVAVIENAEVDFTGGLNVLTGETGAGKSIVIDSINAILGERTSREIVRTGAEKAAIYAEFSDIEPSVYKKLKENDIDIDDDTILLQRIITVDGKSSARINGIPVPASLLRLIGNELITVCGQHDSQKLLQKSSHLAYIDALADLYELLDDYKSLYTDYKAIQKQLEGLKMDESEKQQRLDFLLYQIKEIESADIKTGERDRLLSERNLIRNREKIISALNRVISLTNGNDSSGGIIDMLYDLSETLSSLGEFNEGFGNYHDSVDEFRFEVEECSKEASGELMSFEYQDASLDDIENRLDVLYRISKKYGETEEDILQKYESLIDEYESIQMSDKLLEDLSLKLENVYKALLEKAKDLSKKRKTTAKLFEENVLNELEYLDMKGSDFKVGFSETEPCSVGIDSVEFFISPNRGQELKPLNKIASGGELSRIMLAIRCILSEKETIDTMIFDEIDTGVSGIAAGKISSKLRQLSRIKQVICVTHLPQIAAGADNHLYIEKTTHDNNTFTEIHKLNGDESAHEIARIISGDSITETVLKSAREMISIAKSDNERK